MNSSLLMSGNIALFFQNLVMYAVHNWQILAIIICAIVIIIAIAKSFLKLAVAALCVAVVIIALTYFFNGDLGVMSGLIPSAIWW